MTVKDIIFKYLSDNYYDGLCFPDINCGCGLDDFFPCSNDISQCEPAYKHKDGCYYLQEQDND